MNDTTIERILFHAPSPVAPQELLKRLRAEITLPTAKAGARATREWQNPLRRWLPALAFGVFLLSCMIMIGVQANWGAGLKRENESLRTSAANLPQLREQHVAFEKAAAQQDELAQLQKDNQEMRALQTEVVELRNLSAQTQRLQNENNRLMSAAAATALSANSANFFEEAQQRAERIQCVNNLKQVGLAMRIWANDNGDKYPTSLIVMSNELSAVKILICPSDTARKDYTKLTFSQFQDNMTSYQYIAQPDDQEHPECITAYCAIHGNYLLADGSVQSSSQTNKWRVITKEGRLYLMQFDPVSGSANDYVPHVTPGK
jgi:hypothetical protein